jgi:hypothetical protein
LGPPAFEEDEGVVELDEPEPVVGVDDPLGTFDPPPGSEFDPAPGSGPVCWSHASGSGPSTWFSTWSSVAQGPMMPKVWVREAGFTKMFPHETGVEPLYAIDWKPFNALPR